MIQKSGKGSTKQIKLSYRTCMLLSADDHNSLRKWHQLIVFVAWLDNTKTHGHEELLLVLWTIAFFFDQIPN